MKAGRTSDRAERFELAGDGAIISAAVFAVFISILLSVTAPWGDVEVPVWVQLGSAVATVVPVVAGPLVAWRMHGRRITGAAVIGALFGLPVAAVCFAALVLLSFVLGWVVSPLSRADYAGPLAAVVLFGGALVAFALWFVGRAVRDLTSAREHVRIDIVRLLSVAVVVGFAVAVAFLAMRPGQGEFAEAVAFMLVGAVLGGSVVTMADLAARLAERDPPEAVSPVR